jgi:hypothetical protein
MNTNQPGRIFASTILALFVVHFCLAGMRETPTQHFMRKKLEYSNRVLEGIVLEKFDLISQNAIAMRKMNQTNAFWMLRNPEYLALITNFQNNLDTLYFAAGDKNLDAATEAYVKVTRSCIDCHRTFRLRQRAEHPVSQATEFQSPDF